MYQVFSYLGRSGRKTLPVISDVFGLFELPGIVRNKHRLGCGRRKI
jgi:hypothetical protein